jgi:GT2 family glycosyltransferase
MKIVFLVPTRNREVSLIFLLEKLLSQVAKLNEVTIRVCILNTGIEPYATNFEKLGPMVHYQHLPLEGYVEARNHLINLFLDDNDWIIFLDDDEYPDVGYLDAVLDAIKSREFVIGTGPVLPDFGNYLGWKRKISRYKHNVFNEETQFVKFASSGNLMINVTKLFEKISMPIFDKKYNSTGGEDSDFSKRVRAEFGDSAIGYVKDAIVFEHVPIERRTLLFMGRKAINLGKIQYVSQMTKPIYWQISIFFRSVIFMLVTQFSTLIGDIFHLFLVKLTEFVFEIFRVVSYAISFLRRRKDHD